jgi:DNA replication protein DnaC
MASDELGIEVDADAIGVRFDRQSPVRVGGGDGVAVGIKRDAELARGARGCCARNIVAVLGERLQMRHVKSHYQAFATTAAQKQISHLAYLADLIEGEAARRETRAIERRITNARFPVLKTMEDFEWMWPKKINRPQIQNLFRLAFVTTNTNVVFISTVGLGKTHCAIALGHAACIGGHSVLFTTAVDIINTLAAAQSAGRLKREIGRYLKPGLLIIDELGYLPIDKYGADLLFQIISHRYERAPMVITTNRAYKHWSQIFNNDSTLTSAILDRVLHHVDTVIIEGKSFRTRSEISE